MDINEITKRTIGAAIEVHRNLGPALLESTYQTCLLLELRNSKLYVESEKYIAINYKGIELDKAYRIDLIIEERLVVELKAVESLAPVHMAQVLTYMKLGQYSHGLLINFNHSQLIQGVKRLIRSEFIKK